MKYDVTVIITIHAEGRILHRTFKALVRSIDHARKNGVAIQILCILDKCTDAITREIVQSWHEKLIDIITVISVDFGAVADARNFGVSQANGEYILFLDGDDLFGEKLIFKAFQECLKDKDIIAHPEVGYFFPVECFLRIFTADRATILDLVYNNLFTVSTMAHREVYLKVPSIKNDGTWAFQDWLWHCDAAVRGYTHKIVPETIIAVRQKPFKKSLWQNNVASNRVIRPNELFRKFFLTEIDDYDFGKHTPRKTDVNVLERSIISLLDKWYNENLLAYQLMIHIKRKIWNFYNKHIKKSMKKWIVTELSRLSEIEPELTNFHNPAIRYTATHRRFYNVISKEMSMLVSANKPKIYLLQDLHSESLKSLELSCTEGYDNVFLITTNSFPRRLKKNQSDKFVHIDIGNTGLIFEERLNLLHRLLLETDSEFIHVIGSHVSLEMFGRYSTTFADIRVIATFLSRGSGSLRSVNKTEFNWELRKYNGLLDFFDHIYTDTIEYKNVLVDKFGIDNNFVTILKSSKISGS